MYPRYSQTIDMAVTTILFIEFLKLQFHLDPVIDSVYIIGTCHFHLYFFFCMVPLSHPLFDPTIPFIAILVHMAHLVASPVPPPTSPPQVVASLSPDDDDPSEAADSSSNSFSGPRDGYAPAEPGMANRFLSSKSG